MKTDYFIGKGAIFKVDGKFEIVTITKIEKTPALDTYVINGDQKITRDNEIIIFDMNVADSIKEQVDYLNEEIELLRKSERMAISRLKYFLIMHGYKNSNNFKNSFRSVESIDES